MVHLIPKVSVWLSFLCVTNKKDEFWTTAWIYNTTNFSSVCEAFMIIVLCIRVVFVRFQACFLQKKRTCAPKIASVTLCNIDGDNFIHYFTYQYHYLCPNTCVYHIFSYLQSASDMYPCDPYGRNSVITPSYSGKREMVSNQLAPIGKVCRRPRISQYYSPAASGKSGET